MFDKSDFLNQRIDLTPYTQSQVEYLLRVHNNITFPYRSLTEGNISISTTPGILREDFILNIDELCYMTTAPPDLLDHQRILDEFSGDVLLTGLGLGVGAILANANPKIRTVTILEINENIINIIEPMIHEVCERIKPTIILCDANEYIASQRFDYAYVDHDYAQADNTNVSKYANIVYNWITERRELENSWQ